MKELLVVVDMQKDFVDGALGTAEAEAIVPAVEKAILAAKARGAQIVFTQDTHGENYLDTQEGHNLPVPHCIRGTEGWQIVPALRPYAEGCRVFEKPAFGSMALADYAREQQFERIELVGLCTDICVLSNAILLKAALPETPVAVHGSCCAGVTPESHANALAALQMCQVAVD